MTRKEYYNKIKSVIDKGFIDYQKKLGEYNTLKMERLKGHFSMDYLNHVIIPRMSQLRTELLDIQEGVRSQIKALTEDKKKELANIDVLNPSKLTDDVKLLQGGLILKESDIEGILNRNSENRTMTQLALRYAEEHGMKLGITYNSSKDIQDSYDGVRGAVDTVVRWFDTDDVKAYLNVYDSILGEEGIVTQFCDNDSDE